MLDANVQLRHPRLTDATSVYDLVDQSKPLDLNSHYLYLLQCSHFSGSCVVAQAGDQVVGWLSGYSVPESNSTFFLWQLAVAENARGMGLSTAMAQWLVAQQKGCECIHASITPNNEASWALFKSLARKWGTELTSRDWFERDAHFGGRHDTEVLVEIPLPTQGLEANAQLTRLKLAAAK